MIVYEQSPGRSVVAAMAPMAALGIVGDNKELESVAGKIKSIWIKNFEAVVRDNTLVEYRVNANITFEVK